MKKQIIGGFLALSLVLSAGSTAFGAVSVPLDVKGGQYEPAVSALMELGLLSGYPDGTFRPEAKVTRAEACAMVVKLMASEEEIRNTPVNATVTDTRTNWALKYIDYAINNGVVSGYSGNVFRPENPVTYEEMAAMLINAMRYTPEELTGPWPLNYVNKAKELGIFEGLEVSKIGEFPAARGDVARMIYYAAELDQAEKGERVTNGKLNQTLSTAFFDFTITSVKTTSTLAGYTTSDSKFKFVVADVTVKNTMDEAIPVGNYDFSIQWKNGVKTEEDISYEEFMDGMYPDEVTLAPGKSLSGTLVFEVPLDQKEVSVVYREIFDDDFEGDAYYVDLTLK